MKSERKSWYALSCSEALAGAQSSVTGLDETEANERLSAFGRNSLPETRNSGPLRIFLRQFTNPLIYLLLGAGALSLAIGDRWDAIFIFGVLTTNALISSYQEYKADASAMALRMLVPQTARIRRGGIAREIPSAEIVPGDIVELESGVKVTADLRLLSSLGLRIDESLLTGESAPAAKDAQAFIEMDAPPGDRLTMAHAGTTVVEGRGVGVVVATGTETLLGEIGTTLAAATRTAVDTPLVRRMGLLARQISLATILLILLLAGVLALQGEGLRDIVLLAIALAVAAIPEGLPIAVTVALSAAASRMARRNVIVRALPAVEGLGACTLIASDKTGTLTLNRLTVERAALPDGTIVNRRDWLTEDFPDALSDLSRAAALCNEAQLTDTGSTVGDAVDVALLDLAEETGNDPATLLGIERLSVIPYEPAARFAAVEAATNGGSQIVVKGAPETVLAMCADANPESIDIVERMASDGYRVLVLAEGMSDQYNGHIKDHLHGLRLLGFVGLGDPLRSGVVKAVERCREAGIGVRMITGDHPATALAIARQLGLSTNPETVVNDGPALRAADIGVAMGRGGTDVARGAADMVLADDNFATIVAGIEEGRVTFLNVRKIVLFMVATGLAEICMFLGALAAGLPMPLTPVQLLWLNLVTNGVQDVTLGFGRGEGDELQQPPRRKLAALLDREAVILMLPGAIVMTAMSVWMLATHLAAGDTTAEARNAVLLMVVLFQNAFLLSVRSLHRPFWRWHPPENGWMFFGMVAALTLHIGALYFPPMQNLLGVQPVHMIVFWQCLAGAAAVLLVTEVTKWFLRSPARSIA